MLVEKDIKRLFQQLSQDDSVHITVNGIDILIRAFDNASKLFLSTMVYGGGNFIPQSIRRILNQPVPFAHDERVKTYLTVDDNHYQIYLNYIGRMDSLHNESFKILLEEFSWLGEQWHDYLDEHGKQDLIHIRVK